MTMENAKDAKLEIAAIGDEIFVTGFQIAGVRETIVSGENPTAAFEKLMSRDDIGIIITEKPLFDRLSERLRERTMVTVKPTVVVLSHDIGGDENLRLMIKRSLGIDVWGNNNNNSAPEKANK